MPTCSSSESSLDDASSLLRERLTGNFACESHGNKKNKLIGDAEPLLLGLEEESARLTKLLEQTALYGESNSVLVCGPRGSGKTTMVRHVLHRLRTKKGIKENLMEVHLHGLTLTDDRVTLKEIARQLNLENVSEDGSVKGSFAETLKFFLDSIKVGDSATSKPIVFVLEKFDEFTFHPGQALLYNLFDISQSRTAPVCVVGVTSRLDVVELLEKRVKSRFSHRQIHVFAKHNFRDYRESVVVALSLPNSAKQFPDQKFAKQWNNDVSQLVEAKEIKDVLTRLFMTQKEYGYLFRFLYLVVAQLKVSSPTITSAHFTFAASVHFLNDSKSSILKGVSVLELCLLVAMQRLVEIYGVDEPMNFAMIYQEYKKFNDQHSMMQQTLPSQSIVFKAFERLLSLELIRWADGGGRGGVLKEFRPLQLLVNKTDLLETAKNEKLPTVVEKWIESAAHA